MSGLYHFEANTEEGLSWLWLTMLELFIRIKDLPLTGYHFWLMAFILVFLHFPFFIREEWTLGVELKILSLFFFIWLVEDFLWFVLNPDYGFRKFNKENIIWHHQWFAKIPTSYFKFAFMGITLLFFSNYL